VRRVGKPKITGPFNTTAVVGESVKLECKIEWSDLQPHFQWVKHYQVNGSYLAPDGTPYVNLIQVIKKYFDNF